MPPDGHIALDMAFVKADYKFTRKSWFLNLVRVTSNKFGVFSNVDMKYETIFTLQTGYFSCPFKLSFVSSVVSMNCLDCFTFASVGSECF